MSAISRRRFLTGASAALGALALSACADTDSGGTVDAATGLESGPLTVGVWGGVWEKAITGIQDGFKSAGGSDLTLDIGDSNARVAKLQAGLGGSAMDVAWLTPEAMLVAAQNGLLAPISTSAVPNLANTQERLLSNFASGSDYFAAPVSWTATGILWRKDLVPFEITSLKDLWRPELAGKVSVQNMPTLGAAATLIAAAVAHGGSQQDLEPGWAAMQQLKPNIKNFYSVSSDVVNALVAGDIWAAVTSADLGIALADKNVAITLPSEGVPYSIQAVAVTKSAAKPKLAAKFIDYLMAAETQATWSGLGQAAPGAKNVTLSAETQAKLVETDEVVGRLLDIDFLNMGQNMQTWSERWQREIAN